MMNTITYYDGCIIGNEIWFSNLSYNALMKTNINSGETNLIAEFPCFEASATNLHSRVLRFENKLYFIPWLSNIIHIWSLSMNKFLPEIKLKGITEHNNFVDAYQDENHNIWIIPSYISDPILILDTNSDTIIDCVIVSSAFSDKSSINDLITGQKNIVCNNNTLYIHAYRDLLTISIDMATRKTEFFRFPEKYTVLSMQLENNDNFILLTAEGMLCKWNVKSDTVEKIPIKYNYYPLRYPFLDVIPLEEYYLLIAGHCDDFYLISKKNEDQKVLSKSSKTQRCNTNSLSGKSYVINNILYIAPRGNNGLIKIDLLTFECECLPYVLSKELLDHSEQIILKRFVSDYTDNVVSETILFDKSIDIFLDHVVKDNPQPIKETYSLSGVNIYNKIKELSTL